MRNETHQVKSGNPYMRPYTNSEMDQANKVFAEMDKKKRKPYVSFADNPFHGDKNFHRGPKRRRFIRRKKVKGKF